MKEEITEDSSPLPLFNGKVECYLELSQAGSVVGGASNGGSVGPAGALSSLRHPRTGNSAGGGEAREEEEDESAASDSLGMPPPGLERGPGVGETRPPSFQ